MGVGGQKLAKIFKKLDYFWKPIYKKLLKNYTILLYLKPLYVCSWHTIFKIIEFLSHTTTSSILFFKICNEQRVDMNYYRKPEGSSLTIDWVMINFVIWRTFSFWLPFVFHKFVRTLHMNFHTKSGICSLRNERLRLNLVVWSLVPWSCF